MPDTLETRLNKMSKEKESHRLDITLESYSLNTLTLLY